MSVTMICGGESPEGRHDRMENLKAEADQNRAHKERHAAGVPIVYADPAQEIAELKFTIRCMEMDLRNYTAEIRQLRGIKQVYETQTALVVRQATEIARLKQLLSGRGE